MRYPCKRKRAFFCHHAAEILLPLMQTLDHILDEVATADDYEIIHQCRVTTRRIRTALTLFEPCFPHNKVKKWQQVLRLLTKSLSEARDLDEQIAFVRSCIDNNSQNSPLSTVFFRTSTESVHKKNHHEILVISQQPQKSEEPVPLFINPDQFYQVGLECLLLRLRQKRNEVQDQVIAATHLARDSGIIAKIISEIQKHTEDLPNTHHPDERTFAFEQTYFYLIRIIEDLTGYGKYLGSSSAHQQHYKMRIAAKRLIFILETFSGICHEDLEQEIKKIRKLQEFLEEIHNCDVWIEFLPGFLKEEKSLAMDYTGDTRVYELITPGILNLTEERKIIRKKQYEDLIGFWETSLQEHLFETITSKISVMNNQALHEERRDPMKSPFKIACMSDIHANLPALEAVITDAQARGVTAFINAGDSVGYGGFPDEVIEVLRSKQIFSVIGNYDLDVITRQWRSGKVKSHEKRITMQWSYHTLSRKNRQYLQTLPKTLRLRVEGKTLLITHGSPESMNEYLTSDTPESRLSELAKSAYADIIITGHSHFPLVREIAGTSFINCGSVGRQEDRDPRASYALITFDPFSVILIRLPYNIDRAVTRIRKNNLPEAFEQMAIIGCSLKSVKPSRSQKKIN